MGRRRTPAAPIGVAGAGDRERGRIVRLGCLGEELQDLGMTALLLQRIGEDRERTGCVHRDRGPGQSLGQSWVVAHEGLTSRGREGDTVLS
ncbi:MAG: hypothetical protein ACRD0V_19015 [Acidimicrobiales bacterium]